MEGKFKEADRAYQLAIASDKRNPDLIANYSSLLIRMGRLEDAFNMSKWAMMYGPRLAVAWNNAGLCMTHLDRYDESLRYFQKASELDPTHPMILQNLGDSLNNCGFHQEAIETLKEAVAINPNDTMAQANLGMAYWGAGDLERAETELWSAVFKNPLLPRPRKNLGQVMLTRGNYEGWVHYELRLQDDGVVNRTTVPTWNGTNEPVFVQSEQGLGDQILHASMLGDLSMRTEVTWECDARLVNLIQSAHPGVNVVPFRTVPQINEPSQIFACSLGKVLRPYAGSFPTRSTYLFADAEKVQSYKDMFKGKVVGISWLSSNTRIGKVKSRPLSDWKAIFEVPGITFVDLQYGNTVAERLGFPITHVEGLDLKMDIDGVAALTSACDLVITVSNTTAHLAGALGVPTWVIAPDSIGKLWYWGTEETTPWYPTVKLFRGADALDQVSEALSA